MSDHSHLNQFIQQFEESITHNSFIKLTLSSVRNSSSDLTKVMVKPVMIKGALMLSFVYRYKTKDLTRNFNYEEAKAEILHIFEENFLQGFLATIINDWQLITNKKGNSTLLKNKPASIESPNLHHDKQKQRPIEAVSSPYLHALGITNPDGRIKPDMQDKFRQINKYVELVAAILKDVELPEIVKIADMGSGKGYLTFALYDYLVNAMKMKVEMTGVEMRKDLVSKCNTTAKDAGFEGLLFTEGTINSVDLETPDILIALHACDTATDDAIYRGIKANAKIIMCSPCCHKQVRTDMETEGILAEITQFGILAERQAEIVTDTIRALILEAYGYKTNIAEFITTEHTPKNLLISAVRKRNLTKELPDMKVIERVNQLRKLFSVKQHYLQELIGKN